MELVHLSDLPARSVYVSADDTLDLVAGDKIKLKIKDGEDEILKETVPNGKKWTVQFNIVVTELDA